MPVLAFASVVVVVCFASLLFGSAADYVFVDVGLEVVAVEVFAGVDLSAGFA